MQTIELITLIEQVYGVPVKYGNQCKNLAIDIFEQTGDYLSFQTLRRVFGFIDSKSKPTIATLNVLAKYCGYRHYDDLCNNFKNKKTAVDSFIVSSYNISLRKEEDLNYHYVCRNIAKLMYEDLKLIDENISFLSSSLVAHEYFFERFVFIDYLLHPIYKRALLQYKKNKNSLDANVFVDSVLYLADNLNTGKVSKLPTTLSLKKLHLLHPFLQARIIGSFLLSGKFKSEELIKLAFDNEKKQSELNTNEFPFFHWMMADYFLVCKMYKEAYQIILLAKKTYTLQPTGWLETGYHETFELLYIICLEAVGEKEQAKELFAKLNKKHFHFIFSKYYTIRYLNLKKRLYAKLTKAEDEELEELYRETKFTYLQ